ncbi:MAG: hypothetical protein RMK97_10925 [Sutterellaceae bacterium]|nr:hypothetical protein [Burkholderiaceae bacterium]MCX7902233.1 hypothetical protein [Burkholderiaceae bacterium]MDW8430992.1 hypothetical protein [Sutterellaceae bacterium]
MRLVNRFARVAARLYQVLGRSASALAVSLLVGAVAHAKTPIPGYPDRVEALDPREVALLPQYCLYTLHFRDVVPGGNNPAEIERWHALLGPSYHHLHHYCYGLMKTNRARILARDQRTRQFYLSDAIREFDYVLRNATADFVLLPEIRTRKGENLIQLGRGPLGVAELQSVIAEHPSYFPAYGALSDYYVESGDLLKARAVLQEGLKHAPEAKALLRRLAELDASGRQQPRPATR